MASIERIEILVSRPARNYVTTKITTADGVVGYGDGTLNGRELAVVAYLRDHIAPTLIGKDAHEIEDTWQYLYRGAYFRGGPVTMAAIASIDMALWDIKAKVAGMPLYQLLGGASRRELLTYGHAAGRDEDELFDNVRRLQGLGYRAIRLQMGVPGLGVIYGVGDGTRPGTAPQRVVPETESWDTPSYLRFIPGVFERARNEFGPELALLHDAHHRLPPIEAARLAKDLEPYRLLWLEDTTPAESHEGFRLIRAASTTPLAVGEIFNTIWDTKSLIQGQLIDYIRMSVTHGGGITPVKKVAEFADAFHVRTGPHGPEDVSPIGMAAALHLDLAVHNFGVQEFANYSPQALDVFQPTWTFENGALHPGERPDLGVTYDEELASGFEYAASYLPVNRLLDGTLHDW